MGPPGNGSLATNACGLAGTAHHCFATAVHLVHLPTRELLTYHGERDQRVWRIGSPPSEIDWRPMLLPVVTPSGNDTVPDLFCSGHLQLADGTVLVASGNVTGSGAGGGLLQTWRFDPFASGADTCTYGWQAAPDASGTYRTACPNLTHDRWYPTLTMLADGRVLISGGFSKVAAGEVPMGGGADATRTGLLELYDPSVGPCGAITPLDQPEARFPEAKFPIYPFMFLLPNGDVLYAGSEDVTESSLRNGRVLATGPSPQDFRWREKVFASSISGGSAVMYAPGKILKTGGPRDVTPQVSPDATSAAETLDLSAVPATDEGYAGAADAFSPAAPMHQPRHFHTLTVLPDGRVLATGGNRYGNGEPNPSRQHSPNAACTFGGQPIGERPCTQGCPSLCTDYGGYFYAGNTGADLCSMLPSSLRCSLIERLACNEDAECAAALPGATCVSGRCQRTCDTEGELCGLIAPPGSCALEGELVPGACPFANNACYATRTAEIWDPACDTWTELGAQQHPRMYHSTALLLPDGRVLSTGGGHRGAVADQPYTEFFEPAYAADPAAPRPDFGFGTDAGDVAAGPPRLSYGGTLRVYVAGDVPVARAVLMRLGSVTHGFDMGQLRAPVEVEPVAGQPGVYDVQGPAGTAAGGPEAQAPAGVYMLFLLSDQGEPSHGRYVWVGPEGGAP